MAGLYMKGKPRLQWVKITFDMEINYRSFCGLREIESKTIEYNRESFMAIWIQIKLKSSSLSKVNPKFFVKNDPKHCSKNRNLTYFPAVPFHKISTPGNYVKLFLAVYVSHIQFSLPKS